MRDALTDIARQAVEIVKNYEPGLVAFDNGKVILEKLSEIAKELDADNAAALDEIVQPGLEWATSMERSYSPAP